MCRRVWRTFSSASSTVRGPPPMVRRAPPSGCLPDYRGGSGAPGRESDPVDDLIEAGTRAHGRGDELVVRLVVATDVDRRSLDRVELVDDRVLVGAQCVRDGGEARRQLGVVGLCRELARPVERQVEVAAAVVELVHL